MSFGVPLLTNQAVQDYKPRSSGNEKATQGVRPIPIYVDLTTAITLGLAILTAIENDALLHAAINEDFTQEDVLDNIVTIEIWNPDTDISILAYETAVAPGPVLVAQAAQITYLPASQTWRMFASGGQAVLQVTFAL